MLFAHKDRDASGRQVERRDRGRGPGQRGDFPLDEAGIDLAAGHQRMRQQCLEESEIGRDAGNLKSAQGVDHAAKRLRTIAPPAINFASSAS